VQTRGVLQMRTSALFGAKNVGFFEYVSAWTSGRGVGVNKEGRGQFLRTSLKALFAKISD